MLGRLGSLARVFEEGMIELRYTMQSNSYANYIKKFRYTMPI